MNETLAQSYAACRRLAARSASNFAWAFWLLPPAKRRGMHALYAFMRHTDDLADNPQAPEARRAAVENWRQCFHRALEGESYDPLLPAVVDTIGRFRIPIACFTDAIDGVAMDCEPPPAKFAPRFATFAELETYCERVASAVGLACVHIWGFKNAAALEPARACGIAFQLTNILRDLKVDASEGRLYLPAEDFVRFDYSPNELRRGIFDARSRGLVRFEVERAERYYRQAAALAQYLDLTGQRMLGTMIGTYHGLLEKIRSDESVVFRARVRLSRWQKWRIAGRSLLARPAAVGGSA